MGPDSVVGRALLTQTCDMLVSWGQSSDCIGNGHAMDQGTTLLFHGFLMILVRRGIHI